MDTYTYLSTKQLSELLPYDERTIRNRLKDSVWFVLSHYFPCISYCSKACGISILLTIWVNTTNCHTRDWLCPIWQALYRLLFKSVPAQVKQLNRRWFAIY